MPTLPNRCSTASLLHIAESELDLAETMARSLDRAPTERIQRARTRTVYAALDLADAAVQRLASEGYEDMGRRATALIARIQRLETALDAAGAARLGRPTHVDTDAVTGPMYAVTTVAATVEA